MRQAVLVPAVATWAMHAASLLLLRHAPELNAAERVFEELLRAIEGRAYASPDAEQAAVDQDLRGLAAERVRQLCGYLRFRTAVSALPAADECWQL